MHVCELIENPGPYVLNPYLLRLIPKNSLYHITHLIEDDDWIDVGQGVDYQKVVEPI